MVIYMIVIVRNVTVTEQELSRRRLHTLLRHIGNVQREAVLLADRLADNGEFDFAKQLLACSLQHDDSKFFGIEWDQLHGDIKETNPEEFLLAAKHHTHTNSHHPEYWFVIGSLALTSLVMIYGIGLRSKGPRNTSFRCRALCIRRLRNLWTYC
jgi:hypothetical protein